MIGRLAFRLLCGQDHHCPAYERSFIRVLHLNLTVLLSVKNCEDARLEIDKTKYGLNETLTLLLKVAAFYPMT